MMRTLRYILCAAATALILGSCVREDEILYGTSRNRTEVPEGMVTLDGSLDLPTYADYGVETKAFGEPLDAALKVMHLYLVVFDENDILQKIYEAEPGTQSHPGMAAMGFTAGSESENYKTYFHITMDSSAEERYIQFIATPDAIPSFSGSNEELNDEAGFVASLVTTDSKIAYWGRKKFGSITPMTDMKGIKMVRNFAKVDVKVDESVTNFTVEGFRVFDTPVYGTIAPFNDSTKVYETVTIGTGDDATEEQRVNYNRFARYETAASEATPYTWLTETDKYIGFMPPVIEYNDLSSYYDSNGTDNVQWLGPDEADYLYECSYRPDRNPFIILKATYNGTPYYYKADFVYYDDVLGANQYYNILRNFKYTLYITGVNGKGSDTVYDAINSIALNNFEASTLSQELTNIALDGSRLYVSMTNVLITGGTTVKMYVKSRIGANYTTVDPNPITASVREATNGRRIVSDNSDIVIGGDITFQGDTWKEVTINVADADDLRPGEVWKQPIVFKNNDGLTRTVNLTLRRPSTLTVKSQDVVQGKNSELEVSFTIPNNFTQYQFPMYFYIEQEQNTLYPKALAENAPESLTVETGTSKIPGGSGHTYFYRRTLTWDEYTAAAATEDVNGLRTFYCYFKTLNEDSATTVWVIPAESNNYFDPFDQVEQEYTNKDSFLNNKKAAKVTFPYYGTQIKAGTTVSIPASTNSTGTIAYSSSNTAVARVDASGMVTGVASGTARITASVPETTSYYGASAYYDVSVISAGSTLCDLEMDWKYEPSYVVKDGLSIREPIAEATVADGYTVEITYSTTTTDGGSVSVNETNADANGYVTVTGTNPGTVSLTATATVRSSGSVVMTQSISYDLLVVSGNVPSGTIYHFEDFLGDNFGDYVNDINIVTDGATHTQGNDVSAAFHEWSRVSKSIDVKRDVFFPYYNPGTKSGYGLAAKGYGSSEAWSAGASTDEERHNKAHATHARVTSKAIDLSASSGAKLYFEHAAADFNDPMDVYDGTKAQEHVKQSISVWFSANGTDFTKQTINIYPSGEPNDWSYLRNAILIPAEYCTANFKVAFDYVSLGPSTEQAHNSAGQLLYYTSGNTRETTTTVTEFPVMVEGVGTGRSGTWEIKNVQIVER